MQTHPPLALLPLVLALACSEPPRVGVVDVQQAFQRSPLAMVSALELKSLVGPGQREIQQLGRSLAEQRKQLAYGDLELDASRRGEIEARIASETTRLRDLQERHRSELAAAQKRQGDAMIDRVEEVAREVAQRQGLRLLLRKEGVIYAADNSDLERLDITEDVIRALLERINPTEVEAAEESSP